MLEELVGPWPNSAAGELLGDQRLDHGQALETWAEIEGR
jgi:hypothetical protein